MSLREGHSVEALPYRPASRSSLPRPRGQILSAQIQGTSPLSQTGGFYPRKRGSWEGGKNDLR